MTKIPSYLKLHTGPSKPQSFNDQLAPYLDHLCKSFEQATGWPLRADAAAKRESTLPSPKSPAWNSTKPETKLALDLRANKRQDGLTPKHAHVEDHVAAINELLLELQQTRHALWKREAELAAGIPVVRRDDEEPLAQRLESILRAGVESLDCTAASLYLLDDGTSQLKLRATWGLPHERLLDGPRPLQSAVADLEAMLGQAIVLNAETNVANWRPPETFPSSICVPVSSCSSLLGTLWVYDDRHHDFDDQELNVTEMLAGRIAAELEREVLLGQSLRAKNVDIQLARASQRQQDRLPTFAPLLDNWQLAGWTNQADTLGGDFHDWSILPDGTLSIMVGDADGSLYEAGLTAATLHAAIKAHSCYRHNAKQMIQRANDSLWTMSAGDQSASLTYCLIDPQSGRMEHCAAGQTGAVIVRATDWELLEHDELPLGTQPEDNFQLSRKKLVPGDLLIAFSEGVRKAVAGVEQAEAEKVLAAAVQKFRRRKAEEIAEHIRDLLETYSPAKAVDDRTVVVAKFV